ncbi:helicase HerA-like domain-containing protein, partial [uncultured Parasutterella sp.]
MDNNILFGRTGADEGFKDEILLTNMSNRHGCITGATGTGKTVSLQVLAEAFSKKG